MCIYLNMLLERNERESEANPVVLTRLVESLRKKEGLYVGGPIIRSPGREPSYLVERAQVTVAPLNPLFSADALNNLMQECRLGFRCDVIRESRESESGLTIPKCSFVECIASLEEKYSARVVPLDQSAYERNRSRIISPNVFRQHTHWGFYRETWVLVYPHRELAIMSAAFEMLLSQRDITNVPGELLAPFRKLKVLVPKNVLEDLEAGRVQDAVSDYRAKLAEIQKIPQV